MFTCRIMQRSNFYLLFVILFARLSKEVNQLFWVTVRFRSIMLLNNCLKQLTPKSFAYILNSCFISFILNFNMASLLNYISSNGEARNIKFRQQVNLIQRDQLGTLPQEVVMLLPHNPVTLTNLFISSYREATVIKFEQ